MVIVSNQFYQKEGMRHRVKGERRGVVLPKPTMLVMPPPEQRVALATVIEVRGTIQILRYYTV